MALKSLISKRTTAMDAVDEVRSLQEGLLSIGDAMVSQRKMMGALVAICLSGQLLSERTNKQIEQLLKR
jgi:endonuclease III